MVSKGNVPYYMAGTLATFTLLASGVFAAAPYIGFLAPVAALSIGLPFIIGCAVLSAVAIALSAVAISKNNTISQQKKFESLVAKRKQEEENERAGLKAKGLLPDVIALPCKSFEALVAKRKQEEENALKAEGLLPNVISLPYKNVEASSQENQPAKEGNGQSWGAWAWQNKFKIGAVACLAYVAANGGFGVAGNSSSAVGNPVNSTENDTLNLSSTCPNPTMQHPYWLQCKIDENVTKLANATKWYENNIGHENNISHKNVRQSMEDVITSVHCNLRYSFANFIIRLINSVISESGLQEYPCQLEDLEETTYDIPSFFYGADCNARSSKTVGSNEMNIPAKEATYLDSTSSPRVDNGVNTLKQPDTSVELKKLTEVHPSVYSAAKH